MRIEYISHMGDDLMVANVARVSMDKSHEEFEEGDARLIKYLASNNHITPFFHPQIQLRIKAPIFIARQWFRSVIGVGRNEVSRRYVDGPPEFFTPKSWRARPDGSIKQGSGGDLPLQTQVVASGVYENALWSCQHNYEELLRMGVAPEQARMVLPQSMFTSWVETGSLAYWTRVYKLRSDSHAQKEIQDLAAWLPPILEPLFPVSWSVLNG